MSSIHKIKLSWVLFSFCISVLLLVITEPIVLAQASRPESVSFPFTLTSQNNIAIRTVLNGSDAMTLMLHTAASDLTLTEEGAKKAKSVQFSEKHRVQSWGGASDSRYSKGNQLQIGGWMRSGVGIWEDTNSGRETDGKMGLDCFQYDIIEIDFDRLRISAYDRLPEKVLRYDRVPVTNDNGNLMVQGSCWMQGEMRSHSFLLHSGYSGGILLDDAFAAKSGVEEKIKILDESTLMDSFGNAIKVKNGVLPLFVLGRTELADIRVGFFPGDIGRRKVSVVGCEILKQFNIVLDIPKGDFYIAYRKV